MFTIAHTPFPVKDTLFKISGQICIMLLLLCCLGVLTTCGLGFSPEDKAKLLQLDKDIEQGKPLDDTFASFKAIFHKKYKDDKEQTKRKKIFEEKTKLIKNINKKHAKGELTYYAGVNQFADLTHEEFLKQYTGLLPGETISARSDSVLFGGRRSLLPAMVDLRNDGLVTEVKDQSPCQSCWTFSATGAIEGQYKKKTGKLVSFSEQQILDCVGTGCDTGGWMGTAFNYVKQYGIEEAADYPYVGPSPTCNYNTTLVKDYLTGFKMVPRYDEQALAQAVAEIGPISVGVDAGYSFGVYKGGVYNEPGCSSYSLNHAVLVVGYGTIDGLDYWLVKNSWGTSWGKDGYILMSRNKNNQCGIATAALYPLM